MFLRFAFWLLADMNPSRIVLANSSCSLDAVCVKVRLSTGSPKLTAKLFINSKTAVGTYSRTSLTRTRITRIPPEFPANSN